MALPKIRLPKLPKCNYCATPARFDAPTTRGPWAYMCDVHYVEHGACSCTIGSELIEGIADPVEGPAVDGILDMERSMTEDMLIVNCPECKDEKHLELNAGGTYSCEGCGRTINIPSIM